MCGVVGVYASYGNAPYITAQALYKLNHRGELGAGISAYNERQEYKDHRGKGLVADVFADENVFEEKFGACNSAIGHNRYATTQEKDQGKLLNLQPMMMGDFHGERFGVSHNGDVELSAHLRRIIESHGYDFQTSSDTEIIVGLLSTSQEKDFLEALRAELPKLIGAFSLTILYKDKVIAVRDGNGIRPLCVGRGENFFIVASENCAFETMGAHFIRSVLPGEALVLSKNGISEHFIWHANPRLKICVFEFIYFARPDSIIEGQSVYMARKELGRTVIREHPVDADIIVPVPESGNIYDLGMSEESGLPVEHAIFRDRYYPKRTFIEPRGVNRRALQRYKFSIVGRAVRKKRLVVCEDSIVRASVLPEVIMMLREAGAGEVHVRVGAAPVKHPCYFGIDMATYGELIAASFSMDEVRKYLQANTLGYSSIEGMIKAIGLPEENLSFGCFSGEYPVCPFKQ